MAFSSDRGAMPTPAERARESTPPHRRRSRRGRRSLANPRSTQDPYRALTGGPELAGDGDRQAPVRRPAMSRRPRRAALRCRAQPTASERQMKSASARQIDPSTSCSPRASQDGTGLVRSAPSLAPARTSVRSLRATANRPMVPGWCAPRQWPAPAPRGVSFRPAGCIHRELELGEVTAIVMPRGGRHRCCTGPGTRAHRRHRRRPSTR
jgi:hypothetical protein